MSGAAAFVDRDGVINDPVPDRRSGRPESPYRARDVRLAPGASQGLGMLADAGYTIVVASNQPAAAKGTATRAALEAVHARVEALLAAEGVVPAAWEYCMHHPDAVDAALRGPCDCRKPAPGMLLRAAERLGLDLARSWMLGDSDADVEAGRRAGCRTVLIEHPGTAHRRGRAEPDLVAADLAGAARAVVREGPR